MVSEMVRVNHLRNCLLCHSPSKDRKDTLRGLIPTPGKPIPVEYYASSKGDFARADVTYLKQDFSVLMQVDQPDEWPIFQRFDFLVRDRELTVQEQDGLGCNSKQPGEKKAGVYLQREAVLFALRQLSGVDLGDEAEDWIWFLQEARFW